MDQVPRSTGLVVFLSGVMCMNEFAAASSSRFVPLPEREDLQIAWPTPNRSLRTQPDRFFATTRANTDYGRPGWTRNCGKRFHRGCDVAPARKTSTGKSTVVYFSDCESGAEYRSEEPVVVPHDDIFSVFDAVVIESVREEDESDFGRHVVLSHQWPGTGQTFYTLYGHMAVVDVRVGQEVRKGDRLGTMGQTSRSADARNWLSIVPHLHFEVWNEKKKAYNPEEFLEKYSPRDGN